MLRLPHDLSGERPSVFCRRCCNGARPSIRATSATDRRTADEARLRESDESYCDPTAPMAIDGTRSMMHGCKGRDDGSSAFAKRCRRLSRHNGSIRFSITPSPPHVSTRGRGFGVPWELQSVVHEGLPPDALTTAIGRASTRMRLEQFLARPSRPSVAQRVHRRLTTDGRASNAIVGDGPDLVNHAHG